MRIDNAHVAFAAVMAAMVFALGCSDQNTPATLGIHHVFVDANGERHDLQIIELGEDSRTQRWALAVYGARRHVFVNKDPLLVEPARDAIVFAITGDGVAPLVVRAAEDGFAAWLGEERLTVSSEPLVNLAPFATRIDEGTRIVLEFLTRPESNGSCVATTLLGDAVDRVVAETPYGAWCTTCIWSGGWFTLIVAEGTSCNYITCPFSGCHRDWCDFE